jgi:hypothetical protein
LRAIRADSLVFWAKKPRRGGMRRSWVDIAPDWEKILRQQFAARAATFLYSLKRSILIRTLIRSFKFTAYHDRQLRRRATDPG